MYLAGDLSPPPSPTLPSSAAPPTATTVAARCSLHLPTDNPQLTCTCSRVDPNKLQKHQKPHAHFFTRPEKLPRACYLSRLRLCVALHCIARSVIGSESGMAAMAGGSKPLRLKDLLELDCESCSAAGFRCYPRRLCVAGGAAERQRRQCGTASSPTGRRPQCGGPSCPASRRACPGGSGRLLEAARGRRREAAAAAARRRRRRAPPPRRGQLLQLQLRLRDVRVQQFHRREEVALPLRLLRNLVSQLRRQPPRRRRALHHRSRPRGNQPFHQPHFSPTQSLTHSLTNLDEESIIGR